jgi:hypothetical protein
MKGPMVRTLRFLRPVPFGFRVPTLQHHTLSRNGNAFGANALGHVGIVTDTYMRENGNIS